ncbi:MAG: hypothetical protein ACOY30_06010 [Bacillota bacterium]
MVKTLIKIHLDGSHLVFEPVCRGVSTRRDFCLSLNDWKQLNMKEGRVTARNINNFADFQVISALDLIRIDFFWLNNIEGDVRGRQETVFLTFSQVRSWVWAGAKGTYRQISVNPCTPNQIILIDK